MTSSQQESVQKSDFSIEHILTKAGNYKNSDVEYRNIQRELMAFSWLNCTRYCPPKLPRNHKKEGPQKRQLGRHPRIPFSSQQLAVLEDKFKQSPYLSSADVTELSRSLQLADIRVKIWFQNRRARERREKMEQETHLKPSCTITSEVKLKQKQKRDETNATLTAPLIFQVTPTTPLTNHQKNTYTPFFNTITSLQNYQNLPRFTASSSSDSQHIP